MLIDFDILTIAIGCILYGATCFLVRWRKKPPKAYYVFSSVMFIYIMVVIKLTLFPIVMIGLPSNLKESVNLIPFRHGIGKTEILNLLMTVPFGMITPFVSKTNSLKMILFKGFIFGCIIETLQLFETIFTDGFSLRIVDVNDIIFNSAGVFVGYLILFIISKIIDKHSIVYNGKFVKYTFEVLEKLKLN